MGTALFLSAAVQCAAPMCHAMHASASMRPLHSLLAGLLQLLPTVDDGVPMLIVSSTSSSSSSSSSHG